MKLKKLYSFLTLLTAFLWLGSGTMWGTTLTVGSDWTTHSNQCVPLNPSYHDTNNTRCQFIYTSSDLSGLEDKILRGMRFYADANFVWDKSPGTVPTFSVRLKETTASDFDSGAFDDADGFAVVYSGQPTSSKNTQELYFEFNGDEFTYSGTKNLLVEVKITSGGGWQSSIFYYGTVRSKAARTNKNTSGSNGNINYLPKVQISYDTPAPATCPKPTITAATATSTTSGSISWTAGGSETAWTLQYKGSSDADWTVVDLTTINTTETAGVRSYALTSLTQNTTYQVKLKAVCGVGDESTDVSDSFETPCEDVATYSTGFETGDGCTAGEMAPCWKKIGSPAIYNSYFNSGSQSLGFKGNTTQYAILPKFSSEVKGLQISFAYKHYYYTYYPSNLALGTMTDPTDASTFTPIKALTQSNDYLTIDEESLASAPAGDYYIAFKYTATSSSAAIYIDDVNVSVASSCVKPTGLTASAASATSINLAWTKGSDETKWNVQYRIGSGDWTLVENITTAVDGSNCTATLTGLTEQTTYEIQVQADCSGSTSNWSNSATETTDCEAKSIPWSCGFETAEGYAKGSSTSAAPECWKMSGANAGDYPYIYVNNSSDFVKSGSYSLYSISSGSKDAYLIFPAFNAPLNSLQIEFYHKEEDPTKSNTITLGYVTDVANPASSFVTLAGPFTRYDEVWTKEEESLASVPAGVANTARLAFKIGNGSSSNWYLGIDDILVSELPDCPKPVLTATNVIYNGATITWSEGSSTNKWKLQYSTDGENWTDANSGNLIAAASFNLTGLTSGTTYQVQAQAECAGAWSNAVSFTPQCLKPSKPEVPQATITTTSAVVNWTAGNGEDEWYLQYKKSSESVWSDAIHVTTNPTYTLTGLQSGTTYGVHVTAGCKEDYTASTEFDTECAVVTSFPWTENFESQTASTIAKCWDISASGTSTKSGTSYYVWGVYEYSSNKMLRMYNYMVDNGTAIIYSPSITIPNNDKEYELSFDYTNTANCGAFKVKVSKDAGANFAEVGSYENATSVNERTNPGTFTPAKISLADYAGETIILQFYALANYSEGAIFVDNIKIDEAPSCANPTDLEVDEASIGTETATATWTAGGTETAWMLQYKTAAVEWTDPSVVEETVNTTPSYDFTGLTENTAYTVRVKANCGVGDESEWIELAQPFRTDCANKTVTELVAWTENFESQESGKIPTCWGEVSTYASSAYTQVNAGAAKDGSLGVQVYVYSTHTEIALLPVFETEIKNLKISFDYKNQGDGSKYAALEVGYYSGSTFTNVTTLAKTTTFAASGEIEMPKTTPDGARIAFRVVGAYTNYNGSAYIDNISVIRKPTCYTPTNVQAVATSDGAVVTWNDDEASEWSLQLQQGELGWNTPITGITSKTYTLTGLTVDLPYQVQVKAVCGVGDESAWSASADFTPKCNAPTSLAVTARAQNSATFSWTSSETAWVLQYSTDGENWESENVATNPFTLTGLAAGQTYQAKIQSACGSAFTDAVEFSTWCGLQDAADLPLNATSFTALPECWEATFKGEWSGISGNKICFYGTEEQWIVLPAYDIDLNKLSATFTFSTSNASLEFGYIDEPNGAFTAFASQPTSGVELDLAAEAAAPKYIAVRYYDGGSNLANATISSVYVRKTPNCLAPTGVAGTPGVGSASISWTESGSAEAWNLQYKTGSADWTTVAVTENPYNLTGLEQGVSYKVRVQASCGGEDGVSDWSDEASFTTNCASIDALPFIETFDAALSNCWDITDENTSTYAHSVYGSELRLPGGKEASGHLVKLPNITASFTNAVMTIEYKATTGSGTAVPQVGYIDDLDAFQEIATLDKSNTTTEARIALASYTGKRLALRYDDGTSEGNFDIAEIRILEQVSFAEDDEDNDTKIAAYIGKTVDVTIGRTFLCADYFNTICLPFSLSAEQLAASPIASNDLWAFKYARVEGGELLIRIVEAESINAGEPYLISWPAGDAIENPLFKNVTISASAGKTMGNENLKFVGTLKPETFAAHDDSKLFLYQNNTLYWWDGDAPSNLKSFRAFFTVEGGADEMPIKHLPARIIRGEQVATGIDDVHGDVQSLKLLEKGHVVIIRNGVKYSVQGQVIEK